MRSSNKSRSRNKNNNRRPHLGNVVNRVFESAGPEGKVRGTPQQIIEKYQMLARDAQLSGDRVAAENFAQHAEHYLRMLGEAQREIAERAAEANDRAQANAQQQAESDQHQQRNTQQPYDREQPQPTIAEPQPDMAAPVEESQVVDTPEAQAAAKPARKPRPRRPARRDPVDDAGQPAPEPVTSSD